jgi:hypothetical protein
VWPHWTATVASTGVLAAWSWLIPLSNESEYCRFSLAVSDIAPCIDMGAIGAPITPGDGHRAG